MVGRRARKSMSGAANDSTTKFPISGKVPLEWLMHRLASLSPGHAQSVGVFVTPGRPTTRGFGLVDARSRWLCATCLDNVTPNTGSPCVATVQLGGVSRPSNVRASARPMSQWCVEEHAGRTSRRNATWGGSAGPPHGEHRSARPYCRRCAPGLNWPGRSSGAVTLKKLECSKQAYALSASHQLALTTSLPFVHTARRSYRLNGPVKCSDRGDVGGSLPATSREVH
ncbi:hypothetical protein V6N13_008402 [Hibiscus sabdariffa]